MGLGDRHPNNIMIERHTGHVVHIDFGDCFEVAMSRERAPERVPFRLTRTCVNAMEVSGIEGNFRTTCELVMSCLRDNKDSLMAVLEAFVHDPLITWRLVEVGGGVGGIDSGSSSDSSLESAPRVVAAARSTPRLKPASSSGLGGQTLGYSLQTRKFTAAGYAFRIIIIIELTKKGFLWLDYYQIENLLNMGTRLLLEKA